jgi:DNA-binding beta-propeller fold protein YncE
MSVHTPAPGEPGIGDVLAGYRLDGIIGRGGMAVVYRAFDERLGRSVALKILAPRLGSDAAFRQRFIRESRVAASVDHPNIIPIFEAGEAGGYLFIAMRFVQGGDVLTILETEGLLSAARACNIVTQVAAALDAAHERGLIHRDVKPGNVLRDAAGGEDQPDHVYLSDFGLSKLWQSASSLTSQGEFLGTMDYVAPEQIEGNPVDGRSDQYALACSAFELLTGFPPFRREETMAIMWAQVSTPPPALTSRRPDLPEAVDAVMAKALAKKPDDRYRTCLEFAAALRQACLAEQTGGAETAATPPPEVPSPAGPVTPPPVAGTPPAAAAGTPPPAAPVSAVSGSAVSGPAVSGPGAGLAVTTSPRGPAHSRRSRAAVLVACVALLGVAGAGYALFGTRSGAGHHAKAKTVPVLAAPGCTTRAATPRALPRVRGHLVTIHGAPSGVVVAPRGFGFVTLTSALGVLDTARPAPVLLRTIPLPGASALALTADQKYLLVTGLRGVTVFRVSALEQGASAPAGTLTPPGGRRAAAVAVTPDGKFAFVALRSSGGGSVAVFNLGRALKGGSGLTALIPVAGQPAGLTVAPDGLYVYVASGPVSPATGGPAAPAPRPGWLTVIDTFKAEAHQQHAVVHTVPAGCGPDQILVSKTSQDVWVSVTGGNALAVFSASSLVSDPGHAVIARVAVGQRPLGMVFFGHGMRILVADAGQDHQPGTASVALVAVPRALAHQPALLGSVASGRAPCAVALYPGGSTLLAADSGAGTVRAITVASLP